MNKAALVSGLWILLILAAGMSGCTAKKTEKDVYQAPKPSILKSTGTSEPFSAWNADPKKSLDLQDSLDISDAKPVRAEVSTSCRRDGLSYSQRFAVPGSRPIKIVQILPEEILTAPITVDLLTVSVECSFEISLFNDAGSRFVFNISSVAIGEYVAAGAELSLNEYLSVDSFHPLEIKDYQLQQMIMRYKSQRRFDARVICQDARSKAFPFILTTDFSRVKFEELSLREGRSPHVLVNERPVQKCRVLVLEDGYPVDSSPLFTLMLPVTPLNFEGPEVVKEFDMTGWADLNVVERALRPLKAAHPIYIVNNPSALERYLRIPKQVIRVEHLFYIDATRERLRDQDSSMTFNIFDLSENLISTDDGNYLHAVIPAGGAVKIIATYHPRALVTCAIPALGIGKTPEFKPYWVSYSEQALDPLHVEEALGSGPVISAWDLSLGEPGWISVFMSGVQPEMFHDVPDSPFCSEP